MDVKQGDDSIDGHDPLVSWPTFPLTYILAKP